MEKMEGPGPLSEALSASWSKSVVSEGEEAEICSCNLEVSSFCLKRRNRDNPKVSGLAAWIENCKWYSCLPLGAVVSLFCEPA
jgi:hypothetical protein